MDFAKKQMEKYGWTEGKGLGKAENGISSAIKPKLKFDKSGLGHDPAKEFTDNWWEKRFNSAAENIRKTNSTTLMVEQTSAAREEARSKLKSKREKSQLKASKDASEKKKEYGNFLKMSTLTSQGVEHHDDVIEPDVVSTHIKTLDDADLFAICGGRTCHKGARHGLTMSGKLARIEKQEKMLLKKMRSVSLSDDNESLTNDSELNSLTKKMKRLKKSQDAAFILNNPAIHESVPAKKKEKKKRKSVTFNDSAEVKYFHCDGDTSYESNTSTKDENCNDASYPDPSLPPLNGSDEGIEQDLEDNNDKEKDDSHKSFEEPQSGISDLSKAERKKLKKKRRLEKKEFGNAVDTILEEITEGFNVPGTSKKRKFDEKCKAEVASDPIAQLEPLDSDIEKQVKKKQKREKKQKKKEQKRDKILNSIVQSLDGCKISDDD